MVTMEQTLGTLFVELRNAIDNAATLTVGAALAIADTAGSKLTVGGTGTGVGTLIR